PMAPATPPGDAVPTMEKAAAESVAPKTAAAPMPAAAPPPTPAASKPPMILAPKKAATSPSPPAGPAGPAADDVVDLPSADPLEPNVPPDTAAPATPEPPPVAVPEPVPATARGGIAAAPGDTPVVWGRPSFLVRPVRGAPGDGNKALNAALRAALRGKDLTVTDDPRQAGYEVVGAVEVGPPVNGRQRARISWVINTIAGEEVGKAVQENVIAAGSLDGAWGRVAVVVSAAAADGIQQLFDAPRPKFTPVGKVPDFPKVPTLPRVPGRALPPPPS
ncbi:MAG: hypothetical protein OXR84_03325, partial [Magnetovibrio sp.]|nr:hypothetical protein [Magnetovibrio sp.]